MAVTTTTPRLRGEAVKGAATMLPLLVGYAPFAMLIGVAAGRSAEPLAGWSGGLLIFAGTAHLTVIQLVGEGSGLLAVVGTGLLINARLSVYSAALASLWHGVSVRQRMLAAAAVVDPVLLVTTRRRAAGGSLDEQRAHYAGAAVALALGWSTAIAVGIVLGSHLGTSSLLGLCTPLCLTAIVGPHLRTSGGLRCVVAAGAVAFATASWPAGTGLLTAMAAGAAAGGWRPSRSQR